MGAVFTWPETKPVVMLCCYNNRLHTSFPGSPRPLPGIQVRRIEYFRIFSAIAPFLIGKRIRSEVDKHIIFHFLPANLIGTRQSPITLNGGVVLPVTGGGNKDETNQ